MDTIDYLLQAERLLKPVTRVVSRPAPDRLDVTILAKTLEYAVRILHFEKWGYLVAITGIDQPGASASDSEEKQWTRAGRQEIPEMDSGTHEGMVEILYTFCQKAAILTLRTSVRYSAPVVHSICEIIPAATLYERELIEMFGVKVVGTPNPDRLLLPDDWPAGVFPLRKSFKSLAQSLEGK